MTKWTDYYRRLAAQAGTRFVRIDPAAASDPDYQPVNPLAASLLSDRVCRRFGIVSVAYREGVVTIAGSDPYDRTPREVAAAITARNVRFAVTPPTDIDRAVDALFPGFARDLGRAVSTPSRLVPTAHVGDAPLPRIPLPGRIGGMLVDRGLITEKLLSEALAEQRRSGGRLGDVLVSDGAVDERDLTGVLAEQFGMTPVSLTEYQPEEEALRAIPQPVARELEVVPLTRTNGTLYVAVADVPDEPTMSALRRHTDLELRPLLAPRSSIEAVLKGGRPSPRRPPAASSAPPAGPPVPTRDHHESARSDLTDLPPASAGPQAPENTAAPAPTHEGKRPRNRFARAARRLVGAEHRDALTAPPPRGYPRGVSIEGPISFARGAPSLDIVDGDGLREAAARALGADPAGAFSYGTADGYRPLREWIAELHNVELEQVLVTNGSMQADAFLFELMVSAGDAVVVERPTYDRTLLNLRRRGADIHAIALDADGIDVDALERLLGTGVAPRLAHVIPNFQNPAGFTLSEERRRRLVQLAAQAGFLIFEDDPYEALSFSGRSPPTMFSLDRAGVVAYVSSFTKTVCPGLRVGYVVGPAQLVSDVRALATNTYISPGMVAQAIVNEFCRSGSINRSIETIRRALEERASALTAALRRELPEARFTPPTGGYFLWVELPAELDVSALQRAAAERDVTFVKGSDFVLDGRGNALRLAFAGVTVEEIDEGIARLASAARSLDGAP